MGQRLIEVTISPDGEVTIEAKGYVGSSCEAATKELEQELGLQNAKRRKKAEYFQRQTVKART